MASGIYNHHRTAMQQASVPPTSNPAISNAHLRLPPHVLDSFEVIKREFEVLLGDMSSLQAQKEEAENKLNQQINELNIIRGALYDLESQHVKVKQHYEEEISRMKEELKKARVASWRPPTPTDHTSMLQRRDEISLPKDHLAQLNEMERRDFMLKTDSGSSQTKGKSRDRERDSDINDRQSKKLKYITDDQTVLKLHPDTAQPLTPGSSSSTHPSARLESSSPFDSQDRRRSLPKLPPLQTVAASSGWRWSSIPPETIPEPLKVESGDWSVTYSDIESRRSLDFKLLHNFDQQSVVCCVKFSPDGKFLAAGCNRTTTIYDIKSGAISYSFPASPSSSLAPKGSDELYVRCLCFSPDGKLLATGAEDHVVRVWSISERKLIQSYEGHENDIFSIVFSKDGRNVISGSGDGTVRLWDLIDASCRVLTPTPSNSPLASPITRNKVSPSNSSKESQAVTSVAISPNGLLVAAGSLDHAVRIYDSTTGDIIETLLGHSDSVYSVTFTSNGEGLISAGLDRVMKYWDVRELVGGGVRSIRHEDHKDSRRCARDFIGHKDYVLSVAISPDNRWIASGSKDRGVMFWSPQSGEAHCLLHGHRNSVISIDISPTGGMLATGGGDAAARLWKFNS